MLWSDFQSLISYHAVQIPELNFLYVQFSLNKKVKYKVFVQQILQ